MKPIVFIDVNKLSEKFLSRERGHEAASKFYTDYYNSEVMGINLDAAETVSLSFLDGLILTLAPRVILNQVVFRTARADVYDKLACISGARKITLYDDLKKPIKPKQIKEDKLQFVNDRALIEV